MSKRKKIPRSSRYSTRQIKQMIRAQRPARPEGEEWEATRRFVFERDDYTCQWCGRRVVRTLEKVPWQANVDHIRPLARGGHPTDPRNLETLCRSCNEDKGAGYSGSRGLRLT